MTGLSTIPLANDIGHREDDVHLSGVARVKGPRWLQLPALTIGLLGVQVFWSIEMSYGTPYLISLGLSKSAVATVFLAGPVSGLIVQPLIGVLADNSKSRYGRRRPYMLVGMCICVTAMLLLGFTRPFATLFTTLGSKANNMLTIWLAILALFSIDFSINAVQAVDRALLVDTLPPAEQPDGNAWAARMLGIGSVAGYFIGNIDLTVAFSLLGDTELEVLSVLGSFLLVAMHLITALCTQERVVVASTSSRKSVVQEIKEIWYNIGNLPATIRQICIIQFFAWLGWFPVLFYTTAFIGELHKRTHPDIPADDVNLNAEATRLGSRAMFFSALLSLGSNFALPLFVSEATRSRRLLEHQLNTAKSSWTMLYKRLKIHLATLWAISHVVFAVCMGATFFYSNVDGATFFTTLTGFSWSITQWAPFSLLAEAILTADAPNDDAGSIMLRDTRSSRRSSDLILGSDEQERQLLVGDEDFAQEDSALEAEVQSFSSSASMDEAERDTHTQRSHLLSNALARSSHLDLDNPPGNGVTNGGQSGLAAKAGVILGIHNVFIVMPQFIMTGIASIIFAIFDSGRGATVSSHTTSGLETNHSSVSESSTVAQSMTPREGGPASTSGPNSYAIIFRLGGVAAAIAFVLTVRLARDLRRQ
ncbi:MFS general substrate transporter [Wolfiporia cocos MD-104 SS10]|uniref:MFS general substrate transporter n=1 Tax=Wolfiporia cocos (strain MD-104) TaxID=742152 RepID=A0A2H3J5T9_WOLCO|nr:MFS general substrate transporter [Wolfiporia cocos MD-104 SS10]